MKRLIISTLLGTSLVAITTHAVADSDALSSSGDATAVQDAQRQTVAQASGSASELQEVVVTAQKREERIQDVPTAMQVLSVSELEDKGATQLSDYIKEVPSLGIINSAGPGQGELILRGITTGNDQGSPVGLYLDDVPFTPSSPLSLASTFSFDPDLADIDHIEVLEGPQSTLYGANTVGGLVKFVTKQPDLTEWQGSARVETAGVDGGGWGEGGRFSINVPLITDEAAIRASAFYREDPGFIHNIATGGNNVNSDTVRGGRISFRWKFSDQVETTVSGLVQNIDQSAPNGILLNPTTLSLLNGKPEMSTILGQSTNTQYRSVSDTTTAKFDFATLTNVASYAKIFTVQTQDYTAVADYVGLPAGDFGYFYNTIQSRRYTDELRLTSAPSRIEWLLGLFYTTERDDNLEVVNGTDPTGVVLPTSSPYYNIYNSTFPTTFTERAIFGDLTFHLTDQIQLTGGLRRSGNDQEVHWSSSGLFGVNDVPNYGGNDSATTYLATVTYRPTRDLTAYIRAASAYRPGGPNIIPTSELGEAPFDYHSDQLWNYEVGFKGATWDQHFTYTFDAFHMVWTNLQLEETLPGGFGVVENASRATSDGAELSLDIKPVDSLLVSLKGTYLEAKFAADAGNIGAVKGDPLPYSPRFATTADVDYRFQRIAGVQPRAGVTYVYHGSERGSYSMFSNGTTDVIRSYDTIDMRCGVEWSRYQVMARVENLTNKLGLSGVYYGTSIYPGGTGQSVVDGAIIKPRTFGLTFTAHF